MLGVGQQVLWEELCMQLLRCQYLYFCTSKASKLSTWTSDALEVLLDVLLSRVLLSSNVCAATSEGL